MVRPPMEYVSMRCDSASHLLRRTLGDNHTKPRAHLATVVFRGGLARACPFWFTLWQRCADLHVALHLGSFSSVVVRANDRVNLRLCASLRRALFNVGVTQRSKSWTCVARVHRSVLRCAPRILTRVARRPCFSGRRFPKRTSF